VANNREGRARGDGAKARKDWIAILVALASILVARASLADHYYVPSGSMEPTVQPGDRVVVHKGAYGLRIPWSARWLTDVAMPSRGDVVVLQSPESGEVLLKRVVAIAGDPVAVRGGQIWIDGQAIVIVAARGSLHEQLGQRSHRLSLTSSGGPDLPPVVVPEGHLLVMGDNRGNSHDGRSFGFVAAHTVLGRALKVVYRDGALRWIDL
jgi:signal peptidase I